MVTTFGVGAVVAPMVLWAIVQAETWVGLVRIEEAKSHVDLLSVEAVLTILINSFVNVDRLVLREVLVAEDADAWVSRVTLQQISVASIPQLDFLEIFACLLVHEVSVVDARDGARYRALYLWYQQVVLRI